MSVNERWLKILLTPLRDGITVADTCRRYGVSRQSFYDYRRRLNTEGASALQPRSRRPRTSLRQTDPVVEARIVAMRTVNGIPSARLTSRRFFSAPCGVRRQWKALPQAAFDAWRRKAFRILHPGGSLSQSP